MAEPPDMSLISRLGQTNGTCFLHSLVCILRVGHEDLNKMEKKKTQKNPPTFKQSVQFLPVTLGCYCCRTGRSVMFSAFVLSRYTSWVDNFCNHNELSYPFYTYVQFINNVKSRFILWFGVYIALLSHGKKQLTILIFFRIFMILNLYMHE